jgi:hypothetical protein
LTEVLAGGTEGDAAQLGGTMMAKFAELFEEH